MALSQQPVYKATGIQIVFDKSRLSSFKTSLSSLIAFYNVLEICIYSGMWCISTTKCMLVNVFAWSETIKNALKLFYILT